ncbi:unnamed protein product [Meganyctiphanes norvegica]|uniref:Uncharacterized protein n=1 Tax=Meganyctiphanes norvegica TaxID=48144 RepID=A0AAV2SIB0_MEGNR
MVATSVVVTTVVAIMVDKVVVILVDKVDKVVATLATWAAKVAALTTWVEAAKVAALTTWAGAAKVAALTTWVEAAKVAALTTWAGATKVAALTWVAKVATTTTWEAKEAVTWVTLVDVPDHTAIITIITTWVATGPGTEVGGVDATLAGNGSLIVLVLPLLLILRDLRIQADLLQSDHRQQEEHQLDWEEIELELTGYKATYCYFIRDVLCFILPCYK